MNWGIELELAVDAARKAGAVLRDLMDREKTVLSQSRTDIKLQADRDAEAIILEVLAESKYPVLAEESGEHGLTDGGTPYWVVDPLDGTLNFSLNLPICCVSIALCQKDESLLGVIYDFDRDECFQAAQGQDAQCNGETIHVSKETQRDTAILGTGILSYNDYCNEASTGFLPQAQQFKQIRMIGSAALSMAYVACGRIDAYAENTIKLWDVAAGIAIVESAGGCVDMSASSEHKWGRVTRCAANPSLWEN